jgi:hypothetical protein
MIRLRNVMAALLLAAPGAAVAVDTYYIFDTVTRFDLQDTRAVIIGVLQNETTPTTVLVLDTHPDFRHLINRCVPLFLTMVEKPGRYYLNLTVEPQSSSRGMRSCGLELRN